MRMPSGQVQLSLKKIPESFESPCCSPGCVNQILSGAGLRSRGRRGVWMWGLEEISRKGDKTNTPMSAFLVLGPGDSGRYFLDLFPHSTSS